MTPPLVDGAYVLDPEDPRAPTEAQWERMSLEQRERVVAMLPPDVPLEAERRAAALEEKLEAEQRAREAEQRAREAEQRAREAVERELAEARAEIERLKGR
jgi:hypothetical protein